MQNLSTKNNFVRFAAALLATFMVAIVVAFNVPSINASAAEATEAIAETVIEEDEVVPVTEFDMDSHIVQLGGGAATTAAAGAASGSATADSSYKKVVNFFLVWLRRVGAFIALIGAIMFALAIKNNDADQKQTGILTMVAGFVLFAICLSADMFDLFS